MGLPVDATFFLQIVLLNMQGRGRKSNEKVVFDLVKHSESYEYLGTPR